MLDVFICVLIVYIMYFFVSVNRYDKNGHIKKRKNNIKDIKENDYRNLPSEVKYFIKKYNVDIDKINLRGLLKLIGYVLGLDIGIICLFMFFIFDNLYLITIISMIIIIPIYLLSLRLLAKYFKKKGLIKDE